MKRSLQQFASIVAVLVLVFSGTPALSAPPVKVTAATPSTGEQGTLDLDVVIDGSGFEPGARVDFFVTGGESDTGNVVVRNVTYNNSNRLTAKVSLENAKLADFDIKVTLLSGRNGKGITLFKVVAKGGGGNTDTTPPAPLEGVTVVPAVRGLLVSFYATGDDGTNGTATAYDTKLVQGQCPAGSDLPGEWQRWPLAPISRTVAGSSAPRQDGIDFSPLAADQDYCLQIRVVDDAGLATATMPLQGRTLPGSWALTALSTADVDRRGRFDTTVDRQDGSLLVVTLPRTASNVIDGMRLIQVSPATASPSSSETYDLYAAPTVEQPNSNDCVRSGGDCVIRIPLGHPLLDDVTSIAVNAVPAIATTDDAIGVVVVGSSSQGVKGLLLERRTTGWTFEVLPHVPMAYTTRIAFTYIDGQPAFTWLRSVSSDELRLVLAVRSAPGVWTDTDLVAHTKISRKAGVAGFPASALFQDADGRVKIFAAPNPNGNGSGVNGVYLVRTIANDAEYTACPNDQWQHYYAPLLDGGSWGWASALDASGHLLTAAEALHPTDVVIVTGREGLPGFLGSPRCGTALSGPANNVRDTNLAWANVVSDVPTSWSNAWVGSGPKGVLESACGVQIGLDISVGNGGGTEQQTLRIGDAGNVTQRVDHALAASYGRGLELMANDDLASVYAAYPGGSQSLIVARGPACP